MTEVIEEVVLKIESQDRIEPGQRRHGVLERKSEGEFDFESAFLGRGDRQWLPKKVDTKNHIRTTQHKENGDWHILVTVSREKAQSMTINDVLRLEAAISEMISFVRSR